MVRSMRLFMAVAMGVLATGSDAQADLGWCYVLRNSDPALDGDAGKKAAARIVKAFEGWDGSDGFMVFVLAIWESQDKKGSYAISKLELKVGAGQPTEGYQVSASDLEGIENAVAEIEKAFKANRIRLLKEGKREGQVKSPLYDRAPGEAKPISGAEPLTASPPAAEGRSRSPKPN